MFAYETVLNAVRTIFSDLDVETAQQLLADDYKQVNVAVPTGAAPIRGFKPVHKASKI